MQGGGKGALPVEVSIFNLIRDGAGNLSKRAGLDPGCSAGKGIAIVVIRRIVVQRNQNQRNERKKKDGGQQPRQRAAGNAF